MRYLLDLDPRIKVEKPEEQLDLPVYVLFSGKFDEENAKKFRQDLEMAEAHARKSKQNIIPVVIDSYGGVVYSLLSMIDAIQACEVPIATIIESKAMSCGAILATFGSEGHRYIAPNATVLIHDVSSFAFGKEPEIRASSDEAKRLNRLVYTMMAKNCGHKDEDYFYNMVKENRGGDLFLTAQDCVKHNLANNVGVPSMKVKVGVDWKFEL